jgi:hypothetical protein
MPLWPASQVCAPTCLLAWPHVCPPALAPCQEAGLPVGRGQPGTSLPDAWSLQACGQSWRLDSRLLQFRARSSQLPCG